MGLTELLMATELRFLKHRGTENTEMKKQAGMSSEEISSFSPFFLCDLCASVFQIFSALQKSHDNH